MRKLYNEFFYIPKHGKVREKVMLARMASMIAIVIMCLAAMSITAYAYFSYNITSGSNIIKSATFKTEVEVQIFDSDGKAVDTITPVTSDHKSFRIEGLEVGKTYKIIIKPLITDTSAQTGFVIVSADEDKCSDVYHTQQLGVDESVAGKRTDKIEFYLMITDATNVYLRAHWGTSSHYPDYQNNSEGFYITSGETVKMIVNNHSEPNLPKDETLGDTSDTEDGTTTTPPAESTTPPVSQTNPSDAETTPPSTVTTPSETTGTSEPTGTTEPVESGTENPDEQNDTQATTETQPTEETTGTPTTEASE